MCQIKDGLGIVSSNYTDLKTLRDTNSQYNFDLVESYFVNSRHERIALSDRTCNDLDFNRYFEFVDFTKSKPGQQWLYHQLRMGTEKETSLEMQEQIIRKLEENEQLKSRLNKSLARLSKHEAYYINQLFQEKLIDKPSWFWLVPVLSFTSLALILLSFISLNFLLPLVFVVIVNLVVHYWNKKNIMQYISTIPQLFILSKVARSLSKEQLPGMPDIQKELLVVEKLRWYFRFFKVEGSLGGDFTMALWGFFELVKIVVLAEPLLFYRTLKEIRNMSNEIHSLHKFVGRIDTCFSICQLRQNVPYYCKPRLIDRNHINAKTLYHPLLNNCVGNDIQLNNKSALITGSNMSGKTSFIRAIGLNAISAYALNTCFANEMILPKMKVLSAIRISDDLLNSKSYYFEEVLTIKEMLDESIKGSCLLLLDEVFKGTNTIERIAIARSVLSSMAKNNCLVLAATHDIELAGLLEDEFELLHFCEQIDKKHIDFDYKIKKGPLKNTNAIRILEANNYPQEVIEAARDLVAQMPVR